MKTLIRVTFFLTVIAANLFVGFSGSSSPQAFTGSRSPQDSDSCDFQNLLGEDPPPGYVLKAIFTCGNSNYKLWKHPGTGDTKVGACDVASGCVPFWTP